MKIILIIKTIKTPCWKVDKKMYNFKLKVNLLSINI